MVKMIKNKSMNITSESSSLEQLLKQMEQKDKEVKIVPQVCDIEDSECISCGS
jgi:hypothetical protein